jgi:hypothetical protein
VTEVADAPRDLSSLLVSQRGFLEASDDLFEPFRLVDARGTVLEPVSAYLRHWQDRWIASAAEGEGNVAWRRLPAQWLVCDGYAAGDSDQSRLTLSRGMSLLMSGDVIRPNPGWLLTPATPNGLVTELARTRDPDGFATLTTLCRCSGVSSHTTQLALRRIATIVAAKGGRIVDINIGDCLELLRIAEDLQASPAASSPYFYQLLRTAEVFGGSARGAGAQDGGPAQL